MKQQSNSLSAFPIRSISAVWLLGALLLTGCAADRSEPGSTASSTSVSTTGSSGPLSSGGPSDSILPPTTQLDRAQSGADATTAIAEVDCDLNGVQLTVAPPTCYAITVPEDWANPDEDDPVVIQAAVFRAATPDQAATDPVFFLQGGPGAGSLDDLTWLAPNIVEPFVATRDVVLFDQRGTGQSTPSLACDWQGTDEECQRKLTADGVNLAAYNSIASANDIDAIRSGLGYEKINVVGISYGTRLSQTYMRMFPDSIRSVVVDSVDPVAQSMFETQPVAAQQALQHLFDRCRADAACKEAYPTFETDFFALVDRLNAQPADFEWAGSDGIASRLAVSGNDVVGIAYAALYEKKDFSRIPEMVTEAMAGKFELLGEFYAPDDSDESGDVSWGVWNSVQCNERIPFESAERFEANIPTDGEFSSIADYFQQSGNMFETCAVWPAGTAPAVENEPVVSEIPTLLLTGSFDPITPPSFARSVAEHLGNSTVVEFPSEGHRVLYVDCAKDLARTFIDDPSQTPDTSCVEAEPQPQWVAS